MNDAATAEAALAEWARITGDRDNRVRGAIAAGVTKNRIHTITGISRATIDRILKEHAMTTTTVILTGNLNTARLIDGLYAWSGDTPTEQADQFVEAALEEYRTIIESHTGGTWVRDFSEVIVDIDSQDVDEDEIERLIEDIDLVPIHQKVCGES
jgi:hypothetical protein